MRGQYSIQNPAWRPDVEWSTRLQDEGTITLRADMIWCITARIPIDYTT